MLVAVMKCKRQQRLRELTKEKTGRDDTQVAARRTIEVLFPGREILKTVQKSTIVSKSYQQRPLSYQVLVVSKSSLTQCRRLQSTGRCTGRCSSAGRDPSTTAMQCCLRWSAFVLGRRASRITTIIPTLEMPKTRFGGGHGDRRACGAVEIAKDGSDESKGVLVSLCRGVEGKLCEDA